MNWWNLVKQSGTVGAQLLWSGCYGCNNGCYGCAIVMSYTEINKVVSQWLLTFNLCVSVTWPLTCAFHIPCTHTPEIIDMHRGVCDNLFKCTYKQSDVTIGCCDLATASCEKLARRHKTPNVRQHVRRQQCEWKRLNFHKCLTFVFHRQSLKYISVPIVHHSITSAFQN